MPDATSPDWKAIVRAHLGPLPVDPAREADIVDELAQHVAENYRDLIAEGRSAADALAVALAPLADRAHVAAEIARADRPRETAPTPPASASGRSSIAGNFARDIQYAVRLLRRAPGFAAAAIVTLALGIGANAAIFSVVRAVALRPPPYHDPDRLVTFLNSKTAARGTMTSSSIPDYEDWRRQLGSFERLGLLSGWTFNITDLALPERVFGARVDGSLFQTLGTQPLLGRTIEPDDDRSDTPEAVVLGYRVWQRLFAGDRSIVGRPVMMEGRPHIVVGVMPPRFRFPTDDTEMWAAIKNNMTGMPRITRFLVGVGRLKRGVSIAEAQVELDTLTAQLEQAYPDSNKGWRVRLAGVHDAIVGETKPALLALAGAVALVLLIACANVSSLLLARASSRRRETAIRLALGAGRGRVFVQWLTENLMLSSIGGVLGAALAYGAVRLIVAFGPADLPRLDETAIDGTVLGYTFVVAMIAGALPSAAPALRALRESTASTLKDGLGGYATTGRSRHGAALIVIEVALAMTLAVAGALVLQSFARLTAVTPGFDPSRVLTMKVMLTPPRYRTVSSMKQYIQQGLDRIGAIAGIEQSAAISQLPLGDPATGQPFEVEGQPIALVSERPVGAHRAASASYFETMRIPVVRGRGIAESDTESSVPIVVVNDALARRFWPNQDPIGKRLHWATGIATMDRPWLTVVGVVADVKSRTLDTTDPPAIYQPFTQHTFPWLRWNTFVVRTSADPDTYARAVRQELTRLDPLQPVYQITSYDQVVSRSVAARRFHTGLIDLFAALALALCAVGVYGSIGCWVSDRACEIGVRMALGATTRGIRSMVVGRALALTAAGVAAGAVLSIATSRLLSTLLYDVKPFDPPTMAAAAFLVLCTGGAAAYIPARRASAVDPLSIIRGE